MNTSGAAVGTNDGFKPLAFVLFAPSAVTPVAPAAPLPGKGFGFPLVKLGAGPTAEPLGREAVVVIVRVMGMEFEMMVWVIVAREREAKGMEAVVVTVRVIGREFEIIVCVIVAMEREPGAPAGPWGPAGPWAPDGPATPDGPEGPATPEGYEEP